jgi:hypothetical protein
MKSLLVHLTDKQLKDLHDEKLETGCSLSSIVRNALQHYWGN